MSKGDALARGARSATFTPTKNMPQDKWDVAFADFDPEAFLAKPKLESNPEAKQNLVRTGIK